MNLLFGRSFEADSDRAFLLWPALGLLRVEMRARCLMAHNFRRGEYGGNRLRFWFALT